MSGGKKSLFVGNREPLSLMPRPPLVLTSDKEKGIVRWKNLNAQKMTQRDNSAPVRSHLQVDMKDPRVRRPTGLGRSLSCHMSSLCDL